jgi:hypothetical protein
MPGFFAFESIKYFVLGNEFLAESLVVYPVAYLVGIVIEMISENKKRSEDIFIGFLSAMLVLFLLPLAAPLGIFMAMRYWGGKAESIRKFILGVLLIMIPVFIYISFWDYFRETIVNNIKYAMPAVSEIDTVKDMIYVLTLPFRSLFEGTNLLSIWTRIFSIIWIAFFVKAVGDRKHLKKWYLTSGLVILFISLNLRVADVGAYYYKGFHLLPWLAAACLGSSMIVVDWTRNLRMKVKVVVFGIGLLTMGILMFNVHSPVRADIDTGTENYINYSPVATTSQVIKIFATDGDSLMVLPTEALNYWMTGLDPVGSQVTYYDWQYQVLKNRLEFEKILEVNRPDFIVFNNDNSGYSPFIEDIIKTDYLKLFEYSQNSGGFVGTYVSENKIGKVNKDTWDEYISVPIEIPEESLEWYEENVKKN